MSLTATPSKNTTTTTALNTLPPSPHNFASPQSLSDWIKPSLLSESFTSLGVKPDTKNVHSLWLKLSQGETSLADSSPPIQIVHVVLVCVTAKNDKVLVESHQELSDGNIRKRGRPLSKKMKPNEDPESVVVRGIFEELGSAIRVRTRVFAANTIKSQSSSSPFLFQAPQSLRISVSAAMSSASVPDSVSYDTPKSKSLIVQRPITGDKSASDLNPSHQGEGSGKQNKRKRNDEPQRTETKRHKAIEHFSSRRRVFLNNEVFF
ncbi:hypothetical protein VIGAN_08245900 [Vigna angularis var. angularis]|uniref:Nudix hydrolase domain-containing protein n=1 Tax=Vigna angularis var. angularis TaxID=157739 RepID=A0A0S3SS88_PHAAN|nr:hypothetical protein VIGAN_08245900 [Vigna angularis var. angularis]